MHRLVKPLIGVFLVLYFIFLVASQAPARLATGMIAKFAPQAQLYGVSGTVWSGRAESANVNVQGMQLTTGVFRWEINAWSLLTLKLCVDFKSDKVSGNMCRSVTGSNLLSGVELELPAALANRFIPDISLTGMTSLTVTDASLNDAGVIKALNGQLTWRDARVNANGMWFVLGDFAADLTSDGSGGATVNIFDLAGPLTVKLQAGLKVGEPPRVNGEIIPKPEASPMISDALSLVAMPRDGGGFNITYPMGG